MRMVKLLLTLQEQKKYNDRGNLLTLLLQIQDANHKWHSQRTKYLH